MRTVIVGSVLVVVGVELAALLSPDRRFLLWVSGAVVAFALVSVRRFLRHDVESAPVAAPSNLEEHLRSWLARTEIMIRRSESTRSDWDRHLRPMLAGRFGIATGQKQVKDPAAYQAAGQMLLGPELWAWVDPNNVSDDGRREPGPGRATLEEILQRLEQV